MKTRLKFLIILLLPLFILHSCQSKSNQARLPSPKIENMTQLPRPNSLVFSIDEAENRKHEIYSQLPSSSLSNFKQPKYGVGLSIHIDAKDQLYAEGGISFNEGHQGKGLHKVTFEELQELIASVTMFNEPGTIYITGEKVFRESIMFKKLLVSLFQPSIKLMYYKGSTSN